MCSSLRKSQDRKTYASGKTPRGDVTRTSGRSPKQGQWPHEKNLCPTNFFLKKSKNIQFFFKKSKNIRMQSKLINLPFSTVVGPINAV